MYLLLVAPAQHEKILDVPQNHGYEQGHVLEVLGLLAGRGILCEWLDSTGLSRDQLDALYWETAALATRSHVQVSRVFGSRRKSGVCGFGTSVPALLVYDSKGGVLQTVFPHASKRGPLVTIAGFLARAAGESPGVAEDRDTVVDFTVEGRWWEPVDLTVEGYQDEPVNLGVEGEPDEPVDLTID